MREIEKIKSEIENKHILLDTNVCSAAEDYVGTDYFKDFFYFLEKNAEILVNELVEFEFLRNSNSTDVLNYKEGILDEISEMTLQLPKNLVPEALDIAKIYFHQGEHGIEFVDCCLSAFLKKYENNLFLVTENHKDFPLIIHDRIGTHVIDTGKDIFTLGFYKFNSDKFEEQEKKFKKSQAKP
ncbi:MAG: type II toxin-antitoxin system VapC family toxin [Candidatus Magasanikbacteria bacterium]